MKSSLERSIQYLLGIDIWFAHALCILFSSVLVITIVNLLFKIMSVFLFPLDSQILFQSPYFLAVLFLITFNKQNSLPDAK